LSDPSPADPFVVACLSGDGRAVWSVGGPPLETDAAALAVVLSTYPSTHRATWGLGLSDDLRGAYAGPVETQAGYPVAPPTPERPRALLCAVLRLEMDRRHRAALLGDAVAVVRDVPGGGWEVVDGPPLPAMDQPDAPHRPDLTTRTVEGAAGSAAAYEARYAPPRRSEDDHG